MDDELSPNTIYERKIKLNKLLKKWKNKPNIDPYTEKEISTSIFSKQYNELYLFFCNYLTQQLIEKENTNLNLINYKKIEKFIINKLPNIHYIVFDSNNNDYIDFLNKHCIPTNISKWTDVFINNKSFFYQKIKLNGIEGNIIYDHLFIKHFIIKNISNLDYEYGYSYTYQINFFNLLENIKIKNININSNIEILKHIAKLEYEVIKDFIEQYYIDIIIYIKNIILIKDTLYDNYFIEQYFKLDDDFNLNISNNRILKLHFTEIFIKNTKNFLKLFCNIIFNTLIFKDLISNDNNDDTDDNINLVISSVNITLIKSKIKHLIKKIINALNIINKTNIIKKNENYYALINKYSNLEKDFEKAYINNNTDNYYSLVYFFFNSIFDIEKLHNESKLLNNIHYDFIEDKFSTTKISTQPPIIPIKPSINDKQLLIYSLRKINKNISEEEKISNSIIYNEYDKKLKEFDKSIIKWKKEIKNYDKELKIYNDKYLGHKLSPLYSLKYTKSLTNNSLELLYSPSKKAKSLENYKLKRDKTNSFKKKSKFIKKNKKNVKIINQQILTNLKNKLVLSSNNDKSIKKYFDSICHNDRDPLTQEIFTDMHIKKINNLSKIGNNTDLNGKNICTCYDTVFLYNYILDKIRKGEQVVNIARGRDIYFTNDDFDEVFTKIKKFTNKPTLKTNLENKKILYNSSLFSKLQIVLNPYLDEDDDDEYIVKLFLGIKIANYEINFASIKYNYDIKKQDIYELDNLIENNIFIENDILALEPFDFLKYDILFDIFNDNILSKNEIDEKINDYLSTVWFNIEKKIKNYNLLHNNYYPYRNTIMADKYITINGENYINTNILYKIPNNINRIYDNDYRNTKTRNELEKDLEKFLIDLELM